jgi:hypothetical protein
VTRNNKSGEVFILDWIDGIPDNAEDVEPGEDGLGEVNILAECHAGVVSSSDGIGCSNDRAPGLETGDDASFADGDVLLSVSRLMSASRQSLMNGHWKLVLLFWPTREFV